MDLCDQIYLGHLVPLKNTHCFHGCLVKDPIFPIFWSHPTESPNHLKSGWFGYQVDWFFMCLTFHFLTIPLKESILKLIGPTSSRRQNWRSTSSPWEIGTLRMFSLYIGCARFVPQQLRMLPQTIILVVRIAGVGSDGCGSIFPNGVMSRVTPPFSPSISSQHLSGDKFSLVLCCIGDLHNPVIWMFPKIVVPPNHPLKNRVFPYFHHPFWG